MGLIDYFKKIFKGNQPSDTSLQGSQRSLSWHTVANSHLNWDLEIDENPIRTPHIAQQLIEIRNTCYESRFCIRMAIEDAFANYYGDDQDAFMIGDYIDKDLTIPVNAELKELFLELIERKENYHDYVLGGDKLHSFLDCALSYGDSFGEIGINKNNKGEYYVSRLLKLPTWQMFRIEDDQGNLTKFEQRKYIQDRDAIQFHPLKILHFRYDLASIYGRSIFNTSIPYWDKYKESVHNLQIAARVLANNPNVHIFSEKMTNKQIDDYRNEIETRKRQEEILSDLYLYNGMDVRKIANVNPSLKPLQDVFLEWRAKMIPAGFPTYNFPNFPSQKARDISGEPSRRYSRMCNDWRSMLTKGIRQVFDTEIVLRKGYDWWLSNAKYNIEWSDLILDQTSVRNDDELTGVNSRGNDGEDE